MLWFWKWTYHQNESNKFNQVHKETIMKNLTKIQNSRWLSIIPVAIIAAGMGVISMPAQAEYPERPINLIVGFGAGGGVDTFARTFAANAKASLGVPLVVINKAGAASTIAARQVKSSRPDGYTLFVTNGSTLASRIMLMGKKAKMKLDIDFKTLGSMGQLVTALMVPAGSPFQTAADMVKFAKENPGKLRWSHPGRGSLHMLAGAVFLADNGIKAQDVPFKGGGKARNSVAGSQVNFGFMGVQLIGGFENKLRAIGVTSAQRDTVFKNVPTFGEQGLPQMKLSGPITIYAPAGIKSNIEAKLVKVVAAIAQSKGFLSMAKKGGLSAGYLSPKETKNLIGGVSDLVRPIVNKMKK
jgi:tripartite-type tricarboxylate transporter receptor subunit TctC